MNIEQVLKNIEIHFSTLSDECKSDIKKNSKVLKLDKEVKIVKEGQFADKTYFIAEGSARAFYRNIRTLYSFRNFQRKCKYSIKQIYRIR